MLPIYHIKERNYYQFFFINSSLLSDFLNLLFVRSIFDLLISNSFDSKLRSKVLTHDFLAFFSTWWTTSFADNIYQRTQYCNLPLYCPYPRRVIGLKVESCGAIHFQHGTPVHIHCCLVILILYSLDISMRDSFFVNVCEITIISMLLRDFWINKNHLLVLLSPAGFFLWIVLIGKWLL